MHIYLNPQVTFIAGTEYRGAKHIKWDTEATDADKLSEFSGRLCYLSYGTDAGIQGHKTIQGRSDNKQYMANIIATKHGSVTEHNLFVFLFEGISRSLSHELVRHRHLQFSQLSQRYVDESDLAFVVPPEILDSGLHSEEYKIFLNSCARAKDDYRQLLEKAEAKLAVIEGTIAKKRARQTARSVLPNAAETKIVTSGNARAWRHFLVLRGNEAADREIRRLAVEVAAVLKAEAPSIFQDVTIETADDGFMKVVVANGSI